MTDNPLRIRRTMNDAVWKVAGYLLDLLLIIAIGIIAWMTTQLYTIHGDMRGFSTRQDKIIESLIEMQSCQKEVTRELQLLKEWQSGTEASQFTMSDGFEMAKEFAKLKEFIAKIPLESPPSWFKNQVDENSADIKELNALLLAHISNRAEHSR
ncbi:MAG: hypothetical protein D4S01_04525 [Dehalococcoidia bacterium]|nr:MAG: hypothetical protein D4S01_04525 [Dehalococcoidia bacterium]